MRTIGSGRKAGTPNRATAEVKTLAQEHGPTAIARLADVMNDPAAPWQAQIAAARELLDRGYGKASSSHLAVHMQVQANPLAGMPLAESADRAEQIARRARAAADAEAAQLREPLLLDAAIVEHEPDAQG